MKRVNKLSWYPIDKKGHTAIRVFLNTKAMEQMGCDKLVNNEVMVDYDFKKKRVIITPLNYKDEEN